MNVPGVPFDHERYYALERDTTAAGNDVATFGIPEDGLRTVGENLRSQMAGGRVP